MSTALDYSERFKNRNLATWFKPNEPTVSFTGREDELREIHRIFQEDDTTVIITQNASSSGSIGKTELAKKYAQVYDEFYQGNVLWVKAGKTSILNSFEKLSSWQYIDMGVQETNIAELSYAIDDAYEFLSQKRSLIIFDGVEEYENMEQYLPKMWNRKKNPRILMTMFNAEMLKVKELDKVHVLNLDVLSEDESILLAERMLGRNRDTLVTEELGDFVRILERMPLALKHAAAYINHTGCEIKEYIQLFKKMKDESNADCDVKCFEEIVNVTVRMAIQMFESSGKVGITATEILGVISYLSPEVIQKTLLLSLVGNSAEDDVDRKQEAEVILNRALDLLKLYSLIESVEGLGERLVVQRMVQGAVRSILCKRNEGTLSDMNNTEEVTLKKAMKIAYGYKLDKIHYENDVDKSEALSSYYEFLDMDCHFTSLWCHACNYFDLVKEFYFEPLDCERTPIHILLIRGKQDETTKILKHFSSNCLEKFKDIAECMEAVTNASDLWRFKPLHVAAIFNRFDAVKTLISFGADVNQFGYENRTALHFSAERGYVDIVQFLVNEAKADINIKCLCYSNIDGHTAADEAAKNGQVEVIRILSKDFPPLDRNIYILSSILSSDNARKIDTLSMFFEELDEEMMREVLKNGLHGLSPLRIVAYKNDVALMEYLIDKGALRDLPGIMDLEHASIAGNLDIIELLVRKGINPRERFGGLTSVLHKAAHYGHLNIVRYFVDQLNMEVNIIDSAGRSPLYFAAQDGRLDVIKFLFQRGSTMTVVGYFQWWLPRSTVIAKVKCFVSDVMKKSGFKGNENYMALECRSVLEKSGITALNVAAALGEIENVKQLMEGKGIDEEFTRDVYMSMKFAELYRWSEVYEYLFRHCVKVDSPINYATWPVRKKKICRRFFDKCFSLNSVS